MTDKTTEYFLKHGREAKWPPIMIATQDPVNYEELVETMRGEVIKLGGVAIKETKFSMGTHLETIEAYEAPECPYECGIVTDIIQDHGNIMYEIDYNILIYEKWLRRT